MSEEQSRENPREREAVKTMAQFLYDTCLGVFVMVVMYAIGGLLGYTFDPTTWWVLPEVSFAGGLAAGGVGFAVCRTAIRVLAGKAEQEIIDNNAPSRTQQLSIRLGTVFQVHETKNALISHVVGNTAAHMGGAFAAAVMTYDSTGMNPLDALPLGLASMVVQLGYRYVHYARLRVPAPWWAETALIFKEGETLKNIMRGWAVLAKGPSSHKKDMFGQEQAHVGYYQIPQDGNWLHMVPALLDRLAKPAQKAHAWSFVVACCVLAMNRQNILMNDENAEARQRVVAVLWALPVLAQEIRDAWSKQELAVPVLSLFAAAPADGEGNALLSEHPRGLSSGAQPETSRSASGANTASLFGGGSAGGGNDLEAALSTSPTETSGCAGFFARRWGGGQGAAPASVAPKNKPESPTFVPALILREQVLQAELQAQIEARSAPAPAPASASGYSSS